METVFYKGHEFDVDAVVKLMDDELRENLHDERDWKSEQEFFDAYCKAHAEKYGEDFQIN